MTLPLRIVHRFAGSDPWENLAREELWLDRADPEPVLLLYINRPCIVLGRHQNPLREVKLDEAARRGVPLVRRASGGGTVWHDEGNLNWSFLLPKEGYDRARVSAFVAGALEPLGLALEVGEKGDLFHNGKKVSGAAYLFRRDRVLHHGTLLCSARLDDLRGVLGATGTLTQWVGVASRPMPVANLGVSVEDACGALGATGAGNGVFDEDFERRVAERAAERRTAQWLWDQTPPFTWEGPTRRGFLRARVKEGLVEELWDDRNQNISNMVGKRFFDRAFFESIGEAP